MRSAATLKLFESKKTCFFLHVSNVLGVCRGLCVCDRTPHMPKLATCLLAQFSNKMAGKGNVQLLLNKENAILLNSNFSFKLLAHLVISNIYRGELLDYDILFMIPSISLQFSGQVNVFSPFTLAFYVYLKIRMQLWTQIRQKNKSEI